MSKQVNVKPAPFLERLSPLEGAAWGGFLRVHATLARTLDEELRAAHGLPLAWYDVLLQLALSPGERLRLSDLAGRVLLTLSGVSRLVDRVEREGLVQREPDPEDGRATCAVLTAAGRDRLAEAHPTHLAGLHRHFLAHLSEAEQRALGTIWRRVLDAHAERPPLR